MSQLAELENSVKDFDSIVQEIKKLSQKQVHTQKLKELASNCIQKIPVIYKLSKNDNFTNFEKMKVQKLMKEFESLLVNYQQAYNTCKQKLQQNVEELKNSKISFQQSMKQDEASQSKMQNHQTTQNINESSDQTLQQPIIHETDMEVRQRVESEFTVEGQEENYQQQQIPPNLEHMEALIEEKNKEILEIEKIVKDVQVIQIQCQDLVNKQGQQLNAIENNLTTSNQNVKQGEKNLGDAKTLHIAARKKQCIIIIICLAIIAVIVIPSVLLG